MLHEQKNHVAIGRNSERCFYHTDLSRFVLPISDPSDRFHLIIPEIRILSSGNQVSEFLLPFNNLYQAPDFVKFRSIHFNFPVPERYVYLSGAWKMKMAKPKIEGTPTVGLILKK